jgi:hypothetical protein
VVVTWDAIYKIATLLVDTGIFVCAALSLTTKKRKRKKKK